MDIIKGFINFFEKKPKLHILSDSHGEAFYKLDFKSINRRPSYCIVQGATASGLANPNSKTKALPLFMEYLNSRVKKDDEILVELGEVDCGFALWLIAKKNNNSIEEQLNYTLDKYFNFLKRISKFTIKPLLVASAILPTIQDGKYKGDVANLRREVESTQLERTQLTLKFNRKLKDFCIKNNFQFIDLDEDLLDIKTNLVKDEYRNEDELDHHLNPLKLAILFENKIKQMDEKIS